MTDEEEALYDEQDRLKHDDKLMELKERGKKMTIMKVIQELKENRDIYPVKVINGYTVRTIFSHRTRDGEVKIKVIVVYDNSNLDNVLQMNVDCENLYGALLATTVYPIECPGNELNEQDFTDIADRVCQFL